MSWIALGIAAQVLATFAVFIDKAVIARHRPHPLALLCLVGLSNLVLAVVLLIARGWPAVAFGVAAAALGSGMLLVLYLLPYFIALQQADVSAVGTLSQLSSLWTLILAAAFLAERPSTVQYVGFATVLVGALSIELTSGHTTRPHTRTIALMATASLLAALGAVLAKHAYSGASFWHVTLLVSLGAVAGSVMALLASPNRLTILHLLPTLPRTLFAAMALAELLNLGFEVLYLLAISRGPVGLVSVTAGVQPALLVVGGALLSVVLPNLYKERTDRRTLSKRVAGAVVVAAGLGMLR